MTNTTRSIIIILYLEPCVYCNREYLWKNGIWNFDIKREFHRIALNFGISGDNKTEINVFRKRLIPN